MFTVCFVQHAAEWPLFIPVSKFLQQNGAKVKHVCKGLTAHKEYLAAGFESYFISSLFNDASVLTLEEKQKMDLKYGPPGIREVLGSDVQLKYFFGSDETAQEDLVVKALKFWETFCDEQKIDYFIMRETATFATRTAYLVARQRGIPFIQLMVGPTEESFTMCDVGETYAWQELLTALQAKKDFPLTIEKKAMVNDFIAARLKSNDTMPMRFVPPSLFSSLRKLVGSQLSQSKINQQNDPTLVAASRRAQFELWKKMKWKYWTNLFFEYDTQDPKEKFIYFPFYSGNEASYLSLDHFWALNQISLIEEVAHSLPAGYKLYLKEHPLNPGYFTYSELRRMQKIPNVKVLHPTVSTFDLTHGSAAIVTVEGTVGWEAFLAQKPVVCLGKNPYYSYSSLIYTVGNMAELPAVLWKSIRNTTLYKENEEEWAWFIYTVVSTCGWNASITRTKPPYGFVDDEKNAERMGTLLLEKMKRNLSL